ncbi:alpha-amylase family protein [Geminicoccus flavidas]|uniref:alpha-amylase family protein n=1 Tax=Geminicoccus flavidas TaxID=2506407 RepID=UPI00135B0F54|nr:alpha-amylase family protein [Geminicoccus flavidas]
MLDLWYKNAVIYCIDVETFQDGNDDGVGDFAGLIERLDYLEALEVTCIWLTPFYPTPNRDNGYDITDFYAVDPRLGTLGDFVNFARAARHRGMRVIVDLVVNHTSVDHPWFQAARSDPNSPYRDWYVWSKEKPEDAEDGVVFPGVQDSTWTWDEQAGAYYFHRFYEHQADLNIANPAVTEEIQKIMGFWLELGVVGFRLDAVPFLIEYTGLDSHPEGDPHEYLTELRRFLSWRKAEAVLLAEANIPMEMADEYFGRDDRMTMVFHFMLNQHLFLALARGDGRPVVDMLRNTPEIPKTGQWAHFLRNHDELDLGRLSDADREEVFQAFGPDPDMQIYHRGIRRRLAPMLDGDTRRIAMAFSLMFTLPGTPVLWYGDEIGMGDDLTQTERNSVRTPMQWNGRRNAGFSTAPAERLIRPVIADGPFGFLGLNVEEQLDRPESLFEQVRRMVRERRSHAEIGWMPYEIVDAREPAVVALSRRSKDGQILTLHNLANRAVEVRLDVPEGPVRVHRLLADGESDLHGLEQGTARLAPYGHAWIKLEPRG